MDYKLDNVPGREFGSVFLTPQNENLALSVVAAGWAKARVSLPQAQTTLLKGLRVSVCETLWMQPP